ncbi:MAG: hypothetical protein ACRD3O_08085 [Terriglobia bacterium]
MRLGLPPLACKDLIARKMTTDPEIKAGYKAAADYVTDAYARVSDIGAGRHWYDLPYKVMWALQRSKLGRRLPRYIRVKLNHAINYLIVFHQHDLNKAWSREDPLHNISVPADDHAYIGGIWVVELFPPSELGTLTASIKRNSWDKQRAWVGTGMPNLEMLNNSRAGRGLSWWRLAEIASPVAPYTFSDGIRADLPAGFQAVQLIATEVGAGLTAVLAYFHLDETGAGMVDEQWHADHEPQIVYGKGLPRPESRQFAAYRRTQRARRSLHETARRWIADNCPGVFVRSDEPQPSMDVILLDKYDPTTMDPSLELLDALRALGLTEHNSYRRASPDLPGFLLEPPADEMLTPGMGGDPIWALWGRQETVATNFDSVLAMHGGDARGIAEIVNNQMRRLMVLIAISQLLTIMNKKLSAMRDNARSRHGRFSAKDLNQLRETFLTFSMDLTSVRRDLDAFNFQARMGEGQAEFEGNYAPRVLNFYEKRGSIPEPININNKLQERQIQGFDLLVAADGDYREILSTVASLGASVSASRLGRAALVIAIATLVVAVATLLTAKLDSSAPLAVLGKWLWSLVGKLRNLLPLSLPESQDPVVHR